jgi:hypothetical protein
MNAERDRREVTISRQALKALVGLDEVKLGPLSPIAATEIAGGADGAEMIALLEGMSGDWEWAVPALVDPRRTVALLYADETHAQMSQYAFADPADAGPAFSAAVTADGLEVRGPWTASEIRLALLDPFSVDVVTESPHARLDLTRRQLWALAAYVDAHRVSRLARSMLRVGGLPDGLSLAEIVQAWSNGRGKGDPGWSVSMLALLAPEGIPEGFERELPAVVAQMSEAGLLEKVAIGSGNEYYAPRGDVQRLCLELSGSNAVFGLALRRLVGAGTVETSTIFGWRSARGIWLVDAGVAGEEVAVLKAGPHLFTEFVAGLVPAAPETPSAPEPAPLYSRDGLISRLRAAPESEESETPVETAAGDAAAATRAFCIACGKPLKEGASFCAACGRPVGGASPRRAFCIACGKPLKQGAAFCPACGSRA